MRNMVPFLISYQIIYTICIIATTLGSLIDLKILKYLKQLSKIPHASDTEKERWVCVCTIELSPLGRQQQCLS